MTGNADGPLRVALVSTAAIDSPGSMREYAATVLDALQQHVPAVQAELVELDPHPPRGRWRRRMHSMLLPLDAYLLRKRQPHVWHVLDGSRAWLVRSLSNAPVVVTVHDIIPWLQDQGRFQGEPRLGLAARTWWRCNGQGLARASRVVCVSECSARDASSAFSLDASRFGVIHSPLRPGLRSFSRNSIQSSRVNGLIAHVGNNGFYKNREGVLRIFSRLDPALARRLLMLGPPPTPELCSIQDRLGIGGRVEWVNDPSDDMLASAYQDASLLLFPSHYEGFGWPVLEAMAFGLPVVASSAGSIPEVVGEAFDCHPTGDIEGMATAAMAILESETLAQSMADRGVCRAAAFSVESFAAGLHDAYRLAISDRPRGVR